jgi:hypothetical protein
MTCVATISWAIAGTVWMFDHQQYSYIEEQIFQSSY